MNYKRCILLVFLTFLLGWKLFGAGTTVEVAVMDDLGAPLVGVDYCFEQVEYGGVSLWGGASSVKVKERLLIETDKTGNASGSFTSFLNESELKLRGSAKGYSYGQFHGNYVYDRVFEYIPGTKKLNKVSYKYAWRRKIAPHPMAGLDCDILNVQHELLNEDGKVGLFDLMARDWLPPYGQGRHADLEISYAYYDGKGNILLNSSIEVLLKTQVGLTEVFPAPEEIICRATCRFLGESNGFIVSPWKMASYNRIYDANRYMTQEAPESGYSSTWTREYFAKKSRTNATADAKWAYGDGQDAYDNPTLLVRSSEPDTEKPLLQIRIRHNPSVPDSGYYGFIAENIFYENTKFMRLTYAINEKPGLRNVECSELKEIKKPELPKKLDRKR